MLTLYSAHLTDKIYQHDVNFHANADDSQRYALYRGHTASTSTQLDATSPTLAAGCLQTA